MPVPTAISSLSQTAASNSPPGTESPTSSDDYLRQYSAFIAMLRDGIGFTDPVQLASGATTSIGAQNSLFVEITGTTTITSFGTTYEGPRFLRFTGALILTHNATTLNLPGAANITTAAGDTAVAVPNQAGNGWNVVQFQYASQSSARAYGGFMRGGIGGLTLSTAGSSATFSVAAGEAVDSANVVNMILAAAISKTTSAWAVGTAAGGLDTGAIANNTWYHVYLIRRPDTGVVDAIVSTSASSPTLPTNYTQYRRIGSLRTNGSAQWTAFIQDGDFFQWLSQVGDIAAVNPGVAAVTRTLTVPTGVSVRARMNTAVRNSTTAGNWAVLLSDLATTDIAPTGLQGAMATALTTAIDARGGFQAEVRTNTSAQIRSRLSNSDANTTLLIDTLGWLDSRGRND